MRQIGYQHACIRVSGYLAGSSKHAEGRPPHVLPESMLFLLLRVEHLDKSSSQQHPSAQSCMFLLQTSFESLSFTCHLGTRPLHFHASSFPLVHSK